jgi:hypothetical protein
VTEESHARVILRVASFRKATRAIARSLKRSAEQSTHRKSDPYRSAMSMLTFYINRAGKKLSQKNRSKLEGPRMRCGSFTEGPSRLRECRL